MIRQVLLASAGAAIMAGSAEAATTNFTMVGDLTAGYNSNPFLDEHARGTATVNLDLSPALTIATPTGSTVIAGNLDQQWYLRSHYGHSSLYSISATHTQQFSTELSGTGAVSYSDSTSSLLQPFAASAPSDVDLLASKQRVRSFGATAGLQYTPTARDSFGLNANYSRSIYPGDLRQLGNYTSYGASGTYSRLISDRTTVGVSFDVSRTMSQVYPDSSVYQPRATLKQKLNAYWTLNGSLGLISEDSSFLGHRDTTTSVGGDLSLCGTYPRLTTCFTVSHDAEPSGYGGVRLRWNGSANVTYTLTEHSHLSGTAGYARDNASNSFTKESAPNTPINEGAAALSLLQASATYDRDLTERIGLTVNAGYQRRHYDQFGSASGVSASVGVRVTLGRRK